jgi:hypothetical protein
MLDGVRANTIVVGAYTDGQGGICPMLAAHRNGGRTSFLSFARAWDAFARAEAVRPATPRELRVLEDLLVASLAESPGGDTDLGAAIAEYRESVRRTQAIDEPQEVQRGEGLGEEEIRARRTRVPLRFVVGVARQHHDRRVGRRRLRAQPAAGLDAVQPRHVDVQEDDRGLGVAGALDGLLPVAGLGHPVAGDVLERRGDQPADPGIVVDDEDRPVHLRLLRRRWKALSGIPS